MLDTFLGGIAAWFTIPAVAGTLYFLIKLFFQGLGGDMDHSLDLHADFDGDFDADLDGNLDTEVGHESASHDFKVVSLQTLSAFFMGGGWMGLAAYRLLDLSPAVASLVAVASGAGVGWLLLTLLRATLRLQNSGNIDLGDTVGLVGEVYVHVPGWGRGAGRVTLVVRDRRREYNAVQSGEVEIPTGARVRVASANRGSNTLTVERA